MYTRDFVLNLSFLLVEILNRIGLSPFIRGLRRYYCRQEEWLNHMIYRDLSVELFVFGSRTEGTTTLDMESDRDVLECYTDIELIQLMSDATGEVGKFYGYIFKDENTHPGYVKLQLCAHDIPLGEKHLESFKQTEFFYRFLTCNQGKLLLKNGYGRMKRTCDELNGPARTDLISTSKYKTSLDRIFALRCSRWPGQASAWFSKPNRKFWPRKQVQHILSTFGCFITPVGHVDSESRSVEWRLSLSEAERLLIWSLNDTQFQCIVLMKLLTRRFIKSKFPDSITSYHCKNVVFSVIETTGENMWQPGQITMCVHMCLLRLLQFVERGTIPQYFIPENNLLKHKLNRENRFEVANIIRGLIINCDYKFFLGLESDGIGDNLYVCLSRIGKMNVIEKKRNNKNILCTLVMQLVGQFTSWRLKMLTEKLGQHDRPNIVEAMVSVIKTHFKMASQLQKSVIEFKTIRSLNAASWMDIMTSHVSCSLGHHLLAYASQESSVSNYQRDMCLRLGFQYIREGSRDDCVANGLKCANILYKCGLFKEALSRLQVIERKIGSRDKRETIPVCKCRDTTQELTKTDIKILSTHSLDYLLGNCAAQCVFYLRTELTMTPNALIYEMFRSCGHESDHENGQDTWMRHVDPIIMLFYLKFLCYRELGDSFNQEKALLAILNETLFNPNLGHLETALNILGYCFIEQGFYEAALKCFIRSLNYNVTDNPDRCPASEAKYHVTRLQDHNAAKLHICVCLAHVFRQ